MKQLCQSGAFAVLCRSVHPTSMSCYPFSSGCWSFPSFLFASYPQEKDDVLLSFPALLAGMLSSHLGAGKDLSLLSLWRWRRQSFVSRRREQNLQNKKHWSRQTCQIWLQIWNKPKGCLHQEKAACPPQILHFFGNQSWRRSWSTSACPGHLEGGKLAGGGHLALLGQS